MISVIVCTYNRAGILAEALASLAAQTAPADRWEIIVVDNNSSDDTPGVVDAFTVQIPNLRYCHEPAQGLSHARNTGWRHARGEYVAYVDDDCRMPRDWLANATTVIDSRAPAIFGGPYAPRYEVPKPDWLKGTYFSTLEKGDQPRNLEPDEFLSGGNIFLRRDVLETLGGFDPSLGMKGRALRMGEETSVQIRLRRKMPEEPIYYDPRLRVDHLVRAEKMRIGWIFRHHFESGRSAAYAFAADRSIPSVSVSRAVAKTILALARLVGKITLGTLSRDRREFPHAESYLCEMAFPHAQELGTAWETLRRSR